MDALTVDTLAEVLQEPNRPLLTQVLRTLASQEPWAENVRLGSHERLNYRTFCCRNRYLESSTSFGPTGVSGTVAE
jgi:hypothetical protein